ncbi:hypothetical protein FI667_g4944, partial [Globisporangium splendens]
MITTLHRARHKRDLLCRDTADAAPLHASHRSSLGAEARNDGCWTPNLMQQDGCNLRMLLTFASYAIYGKDTRLLLLVFSKLPEGLSTPLLVAYLPSFQ